MVRVFPVLGLLVVSISALLAQGKVLEPGQLREEDRVPGRIVTLRLTGASGGRVWGTDVYTADSDLATAAVHAGVLRPGETGVVQVEFLPGQGRYVGSRRHGVQSIDYGAYSLSFRFLTPNRTSQLGDQVIFQPTQRIVLTEIPHERDLPRTLGQSLLVRVVGATDGAIWGTGIYSADSHIPTAAVHAGLVQPGATAVVRVVMVEGQPAYRGSLQNGVRSRDFGRWELSYRLEAVPPSSSPIIEAMVGRGKVESLPGATPGMTYVLLVTGRTFGAIWGTEVYSADSDLGTVAVHAGILRPGETGYVQVQVLPGQESYRGSFANGVQSRDWGRYNLSFSICAPEL